MTLNDRVLGIIALLISAFLITFGYDLEAQFSYEPVGPKIFPMLIAGIIGLCGLFLVIKGGNPVESLSNSTKARIILMILIVVAYAWIFQLLGFIIATALMVTFLGRLFGGTWIKSGISGILMGIFFFFLFDKALDVVLPLGLLGNIL